MRLAIPSTFEENQTTKGNLMKPLLINPQQIHYLTNGCCEAVEESYQYLDKHQLDYDDQDSGIYPLTKIEAEFVREDIIGLAGGLLHCNVAYSVLYSGTKYLCLTHTEAFDESTDSQTREEAYDNHKLALEAAQMMAEACGGHVAWVPQPDDVFAVSNGFGGEYVTRILIPFNHAEQFGCYAMWSSHLKGIDYSVVYKFSKLKVILPMLVPNAKFTDQELNDLCSTEVTLKDAINRWLNKQHLTIKPLVSQVHQEYIDFNVDGATRVRRVKMSLGLKENDLFDVYYGVNSKSEAEWKGNLVESITLTKLP